MPHQHKIIIKKDTFAFTYTFDSKKLIYPF